MHARSCGCFVLSTCVYGCAWVRAIEGSHAVGGTWGMHTGRHLCCTGEGYDEHMCVRIPPAGTEALYLKVVLILARGANQESLG